MQDCDSLLDTEITMILLHIHMTLHVLGINTREGHGEGREKSPIQGMNRDKPNTCTYCIAGNFRGPYISRIAIKFIFAETNFMDCMIKVKSWLPQLAGCEVYDLDTASTRACGLGSL